MLRVLATKGCCARTFFVLAKLGPVKLVSAQTTLSRNRICYIYILYYATKVMTSRRKLTLILLLLKAISVRAYIHQRTQINLLRHVNQRMEKFHLAGSSSVAALETVQFSSLREDFHETPRYAAETFHLVQLLKLHSVALILTQFPLVVLAEDYVISDLPPPWIPVVFGIGLIGGVGLLTKSLGDVIDEESKLGMQSGARAKKEIERSRSSYFKKK
jgi:hypothetical protein